jgi:hypothetical protein
MATRTAAIISGALVVGSALYYQREWLHSDVHQIQRRLRAANDQLLFALSHQPYVAEEVAAKEKPYTPQTAPNHLLYRLRKLWRNDVVPTWRERWNRQVVDVADYFTSIRVDPETLHIERRR